MHISRWRRPLACSTAGAGSFVLSLLYVAVLAGSPSESGAQEPARDAPDSLRVELESLRARIDSLEAVVARLESGRQGDEAGAGEAEGALARLREAAREAAAAGGAEAARDTAAAEEPQFVGLQRSLQALNPEISVNVDVLGHLNPSDASEQNFIPREFEFSFQSALDPFSRAKIFAAHHAHGPELVPFEEEGHEEAEEEEGGFEIEEGYVEWVGLPGGLRLKLGKFFQRLGTLNRWHEHALPFQSRSLPHIAFVGEEALAQTGGSLTWLVPVHGAGTYELTGEVTRSSNAALFGEYSGPSWLGHLNAFYQISRATDLDLGLSWLRGTFEGEETSLDRNLFGVEAAFTWRPPEQALYRGLVVRGGAMLLEGLIPQEDGERADGHALGLWSLAELRLSRRWLVGARFDWAESPEDPETTAWLVSPTLTWWQSEWVRLRLEYDLLGRSLLDEREGRFWLQVTFAMGPHKHETY